MAHVRQAVEHNTSVLETILRTLQDLHSLNLKLDRRVGALETDVAEILNETYSQKKVEKDNADTKSTELSKKIIFSISPQLGQDGEVVNVMNVSHANGLNGMTKKKVDTKDVFIDSTKDCHIDREGLVSDETTVTKSVDSLASPLSQVTDDMKKMSLQIERLEKGMGLLQNVANENTSMLQNFNNLVSKDDLSDACKALSKSTRQQIGHLNENVLKTKYGLANYLTTLDETAEQSLSEIKEVHEKLLPGGKVCQLVSEQTQAIVDQVIMESTIVQEVLEERRFLRKTTICDFHVSNVSKRVGSGEQLFSRVWYIDQVRRYVKGFVHFKLDKTVSVWLVHGSYPTVSGLEAKERGRVTVRATVLGDGEHVEDWPLEKRELSLDENGISVNSDGWQSAWGCRVGNFLLEDVESRNLLKSNKLVLRYQVEVR